VDPTILRRVCEVYSPDGTGGYRCGSGLLVADRLVLTAAHVVGATGGAARVRFPAERGPVLHDCTVVWARRDDALDVALLAIGDPQWTPPAGLPDLRWGRLVSAAPRVPCEGVGFPQVNVGPDRIRDTEHLSGWINTLGRAKSRRWDVSVDSAPAATPSAQSSPWAGMSGAGLFCNGLLVGVITQDATGYDSRRVTAVRSDELITDPEFTALLGGEIHHTPAELAALQESPWRAGTVAELLRPDVGAVRFHGRADVLSRLRSWCIGPRRSTHSALLLTGRAGEGKTRLGRYLGRRLAGEGWAVLELAERSGLDYLPLSTVATPLLVVIDCAERRPEQIREVVRCLPDGVPARLLLVARTAGEWVAELARDPDLARLLSASVLVEESLAPLAGTAEGWRTLFVDALTDLTGHLSTAAYDPAAEPESVDWARARAAVGTPEFDPPGDFTALDVQMAALAGVLQAGYGEPVDPERGPEQVLLGYEERYWDRRADETVQVLPRQLRRWAVTIATMCTAADRDQAERLVRVLPGLADQPEAVHLAVRDWLHGLYGTPDRYWSMLQPDRLHEYLAGQAVAARPRLLDRVVPRLDDRQAYALLSVLTRAAADRPALDKVIRRVITRRPRRLAPAAFALAVAVERPDPLVAALKAVHARRLDPEVQQALSDAIPPYSEILRPVRDWLTPRRPRNLKDLLTPWRSASRVEPATEVSPADLGAGLSIAAAPQVLAPVLAGSSGRWRQRVSGAFANVSARVMRIPGAYPALRAAQEHPQTTTAVGAVTGAAALGIAAVFLIPHHSVLDAAPGPSGSATPTATAGPARSSSPSAGPSSDPTPQTTSTRGGSPAPATPPAQGGDSGTPNLTPLPPDPPPSVVVQPTPTPTSPADQGPPAHGRLVETLTPDYVGSASAMLVVYGIGSYTPDRITFEAATKVNATSGAIVPLVAIRDGKDHTIRLAVHVHTDGIAPTTYQIYRPGWKPLTAVDVPAGDSTVWFTDTVHGNGWWFWAAVNATGHAWQLSSIDIYDVADAGPAPAPAPVIHAAARTPAPPIYATLDLGHIRTANGELGFDHAYGFSPGWPGASFRPDLYPATTPQDAVLTVRAPDRGAHVFRFACAVRSGAATSYTLGGQQASVPAGDNTVQFDIPAQGDDWYTWRLAEVTHTSYLFKSCTVYLRS
jgi:hypothetical protein